MFKRYLSFIASMLLLFSLVVPAANSTVSASTDVSTQSANETKAAQLTVDLEVVGLHEVLLNKTLVVEEGQTVLAVLTNALEKNNIPVKIVESSYGSYISAIANEESGSLGHWDGWTYSVNDVEPNVGADSYVLKQRDKVKFTYSRWADITTTSTIKSGEVDPVIAVNLKGDHFTENAVNPAKWSVDQPNLKIGSVTKDSKQQVTIQFSGKASGSELTLKALDGAVVGKNAEPLKIDVVAKEINSVQVPIKKVTAYVQEQGVDSEWEAIGLAKAGVTVPANYEQAFYAALQDQVLAKTGKGIMKITDVERLTMAAVAVGMDPTNVKGFNLIEKIYNSENWTYENTDSMTYQGNNGLIFALIALDTKSYIIPENARWNREAIIEELLKNQFEDGSWSIYPGPSAPANIDITGMALSALAPYSKQQNVNDAINRAVNFLSKRQEQTGGFSDSFGGISSEAASQVIIGLTANNIDPRNEQFTKKDSNLLDHLLSYQTANGGFKHTKDADSANGMATEQALQALVAFDLYTKGEGRLYDFTNSQTQPQPQPEVSGPSSLKGIWDNNLLNVQKNKNGAWSSIFVEKTESTGGYFIVQAGEKGSQPTASILEDTKKVFLVENDRSYHQFDAEIVTPNKEWTITFNKEIKPEQSNLSNIYVEDVQGNRVPVNVTAIGKTATVTPQLDYTSGQLYSLFIVDPVSTEGKVLKQATRKLFIIK